MFYSSSKNGYGFNLYNSSPKENSYIVSDNIIYRIVSGEKKPVFIFPTEIGSVGDRGLPGSAGALGAKGTNGKAGKNGADARAPLSQGRAGSPALKLRGGPISNNITATQLSGFNGYHATMQCEVDEYTGPSIGSIPIMIADSDNNRPLEYDFSFLFEKYNDAECQTAVATVGNAIYIGSKAIALWREGSASIPAGVYVSMGDGAWLKLGNVSKANPKLGLGLRVTETDYNEDIHDYESQALIRYVWSASSGIWKLNSSSGMFGGFETVCSWYYSADHGSHSANNEYGGAGVLLFPPSTAEDEVRSERVVSNFRYDTDREAYVEREDQRGYYRAAKARDIGDKIAQAAAVSFTQVKF